MLFWSFEPALNVMTQHAKKILFSKSNCIFAQIILILRLHSLVNANFILSNYFLLSLCAL